jgi:hypothetical protein
MVEIKNASPSSKTVFEVVTQLAADVQARVSYSNDSYYVGIRVGERAAPFNESPERTCEVTIARLASF